MRMIDIITKKKEGKSLSKEEIEFFIKGYVEGIIPDYQVSSLLMAIYFRGMNEEETKDLTMTMAHSGDVIDLSPIKGKKADKHSTGGVGDKTTLIVASIVASCGVKVAKMSGRGLGHTGGTIDKLESISGFQTQVSREKFIGLANSVGACVIGQSGNLAPADKKLYALRDVTSTVNSLPLIVSSIMSKKIAVGADCIVLDVKAGSGAFCKTKEMAEELAKEMVKVGKSVGKAICAIITNMDLPLGYAIGNSLEVIEAVECLQGKGPKDLEEISLILAANMLNLAEKGDICQCENMAKEALQSGKAYKKFVEMVENQGGDISLIKDISLFEKAKYKKDILSKESGYIAKMDTETLGISSLLLGAGRQKKEDDIDYLAGIILAKKTGDYVEKGEKLATLFSGNQEKIFDAENKFFSAFSFSKDKCKQEKLILGEIK